MDDRHSGYITKLTLKKKKHRRSGGDDDDERRRQEATCRCGTAEQSVAARAVTAGD